MYLLYKIHNSVVPCFADRNCQSNIGTITNCCYSGESYLDGPFCLQWYVVLKY